MLILFVCVFVVSDSSRGNLNSGALDFGGGWHYSDGTAADPVKLRFSGTDGIISIENTLSPELLMGRSLAFRSHYIVFDVYLDDVMIYSFRPEPRLFTGKYHGRVRHVVHIPEIHSDAVIRIDYTSVIDDPRITKFTDMEIVYADEYDKAFIRGHIGAFCLCLLIFVFGAVLVGVGIGSKKGTKEMISLGAFAIVLSTWANSQTGFMSIMADNSDVARMIEYLSLVMLPIPVMAYVSGITGVTMLTDIKKRSELSKQTRTGAALALSCVGASLANLAAQLIGVSVFGADYHDMLKITHVVIFYGVFAVAYMVTDALKMGRINEIQRKYILTAIILVSVSGFTDVARYYLFHPDDAAKFSRVGLFMFAVILSVYEIRQMISKSVSEKEMEVMRRLANTDALTGFKNRTAFISLEKELSDRREGECGIVEFDVDHLKSVNDSYGHEEGDRHIREAASIIRDSFGAHGECYRIGGDEFICMIYGEDCREKCSQASEEFILLQKQYNGSNSPCVEMEIAHGAAFCVFGRDDMKSVLRQADRLMYEDKRRLEGKEQ
ncbi:MAG: GGDEF domain-containing protein [Oscillospiraceae bacterium]|nr:GGDEF domain-containing protein [Oscillospiraceae bacterium]